MILNNEKIGTAELIQDIISELAQLKQLEKEIKKLIK